MVFKLYIDSRFRRDVGGTSSDCDFSIELPRPVQVQGKAFVDVCLVPNTFYVIRGGENDRLFLAETVGGVTHYRIAHIAEGQYNAVTLKDAVLLALQTGRQHTSSYVVGYDVTTGKLGISNLDAAAIFGIYPTAWLKANAATWNSLAGNSNQIDPRNLRDAGSVTGFATGTDILQGGPGGSLVVVAPESVNCQPYGQLFLRSSLGTGQDCLGPDGSSDIIRRIVVGPTPLNSTCVDMHGLPHDSVTIGKNLELTTLSFRLTDAHGNTVDTRGHHISFSIIIVNEDE